MITLSHALPRFGRAARGARLRRRRQWWHAALMSDSVQVCGRGLYGQPRRFCYVVKDHLETQTFCASEQACIAYAAAVIARRRLERSNGSAIRNGLEERALGGTAAYTTASAGCAS